MEVSSGRKLKTYGRASRNATYTPLRRTASERMERVVTPTLARSETTGTPSKTSAYNGKEVERSYWKSPPGLGKVDSSRETGKLQRPSAKKVERDIYDVPSTDDEMRTRVGNERKRRKLAAQKPLPEPQKMGGISLEARVVPQKRQNKLPERPRSPVTNLAVSPPPLPQVEVVIPTSKRPKRNGLEMEARRKLFQPETQKPQSLLPNRPPRRELGSISDRVVQTLSRPIKTSVKPNLSRTPSQKLKQMTEHLTTESHFNSSLNRHRPQSTEPSAPETPGTPSRVRLMDALNIHDDIDTDSSTDQDLSVEMNGFHSRRNSQKSAVETASDISDSGGAKGSQITSRKRPEASSQSQQIGLRTTYARQRSFLTQTNLSADVAGDNSMNRTGAAQDDPLLLDLGTSLLPEKPKPILQDPEDNDETGTGAVRSIYELRRAGGNARYKAIVEALFEDLEDQTASTSRRRSGYMQLCSKLIDTDFARRFVSSSCEKRLSHCTNHEQDTICNYLATSIFALLLPPLSASPVALQTCSEQIVKLAPSLLAEELDVIDLGKQRTSNVSKAGQSSLRDLCEQLRGSRLWSDVSLIKLSPQNIALRSLDLSVRKVREAGNQTAMFSNTLLQQIVDILLEFSVKGEHSDYRSVLEITLSILESYTVGLPSLDSEQEKILRHIAELGPLLLQLHDSHDARSRQIQALQLRLILNVTNNNSSLCEYFATPTFVSPLTILVLSNFGTVAEDLAGDKKESLLDIVILSLGLLINLTEWSDRARRLFLQMRHDSVTLVEGLIELFKGGMETVSEADSVVQTHSNVAFGYLSILLSTLCLDDDVRTQVRKALNGNINRLLGIVEEFLHYYRKVEEELSNPVSEEEASSGFTCRLQGMIERIRKMETSRK